jgi:hypothetical protein
VQRTAPVWQKDRPGFACRNVDDRYLGSNVNIGFGVFVIVAGHQGNRIRYERELSIFSNNDGTRFPDDLNGTSRFQGGQTVFADIGGKLVADKESRAIR